MSTGSGITSKGESKTKDTSNVNNQSNSSSVSKASFATLNINNLYRGKSLEQSPKPAPKHGMQTIGKLGNIRRMPAPSSSLSSLSSLSKTKEDKTTSNGNTSQTTVDKAASSSSHSVVGSIGSSSPSSTSSSKWLNQTDTSTGKTVLDSQSKPVSTSLASHAGQGSSWTANSVQDHAFPALGSEAPPIKAVEVVRNVQTKPMLPPTEFPELGSSIEAGKEVLPTKESTAVSLPTQPSDSYGPGPSLRPPPLNWNQRNNPSLGINGSAGNIAVGNEAGRNFGPPYIMSTQSTRGQTTNIGSSQFAVQRSPYHGGGASNPSLGSPQDFRGSRTKSSTKEETIPAKFKASIIPSEKISEFDEILEKGEMKIDWTTACDDIDYDEDLNFDLDDTSKKSPPKKSNADSSLNAEPAKVNRHPSFEDEFSRGDCNPSSRLLYDPRDGKQKMPSNMTKGDQRPQRDSKSLSEKSDKGPFVRDANRNRGGDVNQEYAREGRNNPRPVGQASQQLAPRFQKQLQPPTLDTNNRRQPPEQKRSGLTSLGSVRQRPVHEVKQEPREPEQQENRQTRPRNDSQSKVQEPPSKEAYGDRWRSKPSKGDDLNWRSQSKKPDQVSTSRPEDKRPTEPQKEVVVLKHEPVVKRDVEVSSSTDIVNNQRQPAVPNLQANAVTRTMPSAPPGLQQHPRPRQDEPSWRSRNEAGDQSRRQDNRPEVKKIESFKNDQNQSRYDDRRREERRDSLETNRHTASSSKREERPSDRAFKDFPINNWTDPSKETAENKRDDVRSLEKQIHEMSLNQNKSMTNQGIRNAGSAFTRDDRANSEESKRPSEAAFRAKGLSESVLKTTGPLLARVLTGSSYGPPPSKPAFETLCKPLSQSSSLEHQDSGVDVDHTSAASSQRSSPNSGDKNKSLTNRVVLPGNTSLIGKSVEESAEHPKGIVIFENKNLRAENAVLEKSHRIPGQVTDSDSRRRMPMVDEKTRPGFPVKSMQTHNVSVRELGQDLDQKIASVRKVWDDSTPPPVVSTMSSSEDKMGSTFSEGRNAGQAAAVAAIRGLVNEALVRQQNQQSYRRSSSGQVLPNSSSPPVHVNVDHRQQQQHSHPGSVSSPPVNMFQPNQQQPNSQQPALSQTALVNMAAGLAAANHQVYQQFSPQLHAFAQQMAQFNQQHQQQLRQQQQFHSGLAGSVPVAPGNHDHRINPAGTIGHGHVGSNVSHGHSNDSNAGHLAVGAHLMKQQSQFIQQQNTGHQVFPPGHGFYSNSQSSGSVGGGFYSHSMTNQAYSGNFAAGQGIAPGILSSSSMSSEQQHAVGQFRGMMPISRSQNNRPF